MAPESKYNEATVLTQINGGRTEFTGEDLRGLSLENLTLSGLDFSSADLSGTSLKGTDFNNCKFEASILVKCELTGASFIGENLRNANMQKAQGMRVDFYQADLTGADLSGCSFVESMFVVARLDDALLAGAEFSDCTFAGTYLRRAIMALTQITRPKVAMPCLIDRSTIGGTVLAIMSLQTSTSRQQLSQVPEISMEEALGRLNRLLAVRTESLRQFALLSGMRPEELAMLDQFSPPKPRRDSVFISYSTSDEEFAALLSERLRGFGVETWFAPHDIKGGRTIKEQVDSAIQQHARTIVILSEASIASNWVATEILHAFAEEAQSGGHKLFPIRLVDYAYIRNWVLFDSDSGQDLARKVRECYIPDFSNWRDQNSFLDAFGHLLRDLSAPDNVY